MDLAPKHREEMEKNLIGSRKTNISLIPKLQKDNTKYFFKEKRIGRRGKKGKMRGDVGNLHSRI